jgi:hypothetical protein
MEGEQEYFNEDYYEFFKRFYGVNGVFQGFVGLNVNYEKYYSGEFHGFNGDFESKKYSYAQLVKRVANITSV